MKKLSLILAALLASSAVAEQPVGASEIKLLWDTWKSLNNKVYTQSEETKKFTAFVENYIQVVNYNRKNSGAKLALNQFADLTDAEFKAQHTGGLLQDHTPLQESHADFSILALPESVDWREKGAVTAIKNQGHCGSCWAFAAVGSLEGLNFINTGNLLTFSEQQLVDCDTESSGCGGGLAKNAFAYTAKYGIETEEDYPYGAVDGKCKYDASKAHHVNSGFKVVPAKDPEALKAAIATQPLYVSVQADQAAFRFYKSGIVTGNCTANLNHGTTGVGYGTFDGTEAIIIKNSWAATWGDKGYVKISLDKEANGGLGVCGILTRPTYPTV